MHGFPIFAVLLLLGAGKAQELLFVVSERQPFKGLPWEVYRKTFCLTLRFLRQELILNNNFCFIMFFSDGIYKFMGVDAVASQAGSTWDQ